VPTSKAGLEDRRGERPSNSRRCPRDVADHDEASRASGVRSFDLQLHERFSGLLMTWSGIFPRSLSIVLTTLLYSPAGEGVRRRRVGLIPRSTTKPLIPPPEVWLAACSPMNSTSAPRLLPGLHLAASR